ncbi:MAG TPA: MFS transporter [Candidatus Limnocylindrales bacterium]|nr:MFS transporter [Candidatus Limnocylindrales bacterium]
MEFWKHKDVRTIFAAGFLRSITVGLAGVILGIFLARRGFNAAQIGLVLGAGLAGSCAGTLISSLRANRFGRRRTLAILSLLAAFGGLGVAFTQNFFALLAVAFLGTLNGMGTDRGAAVALEQAILPQCVADDRRTVTLSWYNLMLDAGNALGALAGALPIFLASHAGVPLMASYRATFGAYALCNLASGALYLFLSPHVEVATTSAGGEAAHAPISPQSKKVVARLAALSSIDSLGGGFVSDSIVTYWFFMRFGVTEAALGPVFFVGHVLNAVSYLLAARLARRFGLVNTMVFTHIPSSLFLMAVPFAPKFPLAVAFLLAREALVEMDVPTRQSYTAAVVRPHERVFASGAVTLARNTGWAVGSPLAGLAMQFLALGSPLLIGGGAKIVYDLALFRAFRHLKPPEERTAAQAREAITS